MTAFVVYEDGNETLITTVEDEQSTINEWFALGTGRKVEDFDRSVIYSTTLCIRSRMVVDTA